MGVMPRPRWWRSRPQAERHRCPTRERAQPWAAGPPPGAGNRSRAESSERDGRDPWTGVIMTGDFNASFQGPSASEQARTVAALHQRGIVSVHHHLTGTETGTETHHTLRWIAPAGSPGTTTATTCGSAPISNPTCGPAGSAPWRTGSNPARPTTSPSGPTCPYEAPGVRGPDPSIVRSRPTTASLRSRVSPRLHEEPPGRHLGSQSMSQAGATPRSVGLALPASPSGLPSSRAWPMTIDPQERETGRTHECGADME